MSFERTRDQLVDDFSAVLSEAESVLAEQPAHRAGACRAPGVVNRSRD